MTRNGLLWAVVVVVNDVLLQTFSNFLVIFLIDKLLFMGFGLSKYLVSESYILIILIDYTVDDVGDGS